MTSPDVTPQNGSGTPPVTAAIAAAAASWESLLVTSFERRSRDVFLARRCVDLADLLAVAEAGLVQAVVVSGELYGLDGDAVARLRHAGALVVAVAESDGADAAWLTGCGVDEVVAPSRTSTIVDLVVTQARRPRPPHPGWSVPGDGPNGDGSHGDAAHEHPPGPRGLPEQPGALPHEAPAAGRVVAVWGPTGAPGRTTVAVTLAAGLAASGLRTLLIDADTYGGAVATHLGLVEDVPGLAAACLASSRGRLDREGLSRHCRRVGEGLAVLTGLPQESRWREVRPDALEHVIGAARRLADVVVIDCGFCVEQDEDLIFDTMAPRRNAGTLVALDNADAVVVVGVADPVGIPRLVRALDELAEIRPQGAKTHVVANRVRRSVVGSKPDRQVRRALQDLAGVSRTWTLPDDPDACDQALRLGRSLLEVAPRSSLAAAVQELAHALAPATSGSATSARASRWPRVRVKQRAAAAHTVGP